MIKYLNLAQENINLILHMDSSQQAAIELAKEIEQEIKSLENSKYEFEGDEILI